MALTTLYSLVIATTCFVAGNTPEKLLEQYRNACISIQNQRGLAPGDLDAIRQLRDDLHDLNEDIDNFKTIAAELQITLWLDEPQQCNSLFERLTSIQPDNTGIALAWVDFMLGQENADPNLIYQDLIERYPDSPEITIYWVKYLDSKNRFTDGISAIESLDDAAMKSPEMVELYASLLFADNRFDEAVAAIGQIAPELLASDPLLSRRLGTLTDKYKTAATKWQKELSIRKVEEAADDLPRVQVITSKGPIVLELFEDHAPNTVANFISLAESGYYDGTRFHRVLSKFMAQGGDPNSREDTEGSPGSGGPGYTIKDEHTLDDYRNHFAGSLSMANTGAPNSGGSQFFLTHLPTTHLDGRHTVFGRILSGLKIARALEQNDDIVTIIVTSKRDHDYTPEKIGEKTAALPKTPNSKPTLSSDSSDSE